MTTLLQIINYYPVEITSIINRFLTIIKENYDIWDNIN